MIHGKIRKKLFPLVLHDKMIYVHMATADQMLICRAAAFKW